MVAPTLPAPLLVLDAASPWVSVAVGVPGDVAAWQSVEIRRSSSAILPLIRDTLAQGGLSLNDLQGLVCLQGPGSFTGLRIGLATILGLHQALGIAATATPTLPVLAAASSLPRGTVLAAVDAIRGEWFVQTFAVDQPSKELSPIQRLPLQQLPDLAVDGAVGFGLAEALNETKTSWQVEEPKPLAPAALRHLSSLRVHWDPSSLTKPLYLRPPSVSRPKPRRRPSQRAKTPAKTIGNSKV